MTRGFIRPDKHQFRQIKRFEKVMLEGALFFQDHFLGKKMIYVSNSYEVEVFFSRRNYMHLCGVYYPRGAKAFFNDCCRNQLYLSEILIKRDGTSFQKQLVLSHCQELIGDNIYITGSSHFLYLSFDYSLRTNKAIFALTLKGMEHKLVPQSLLNLKSKKQFPIGQKIIRIKSVSLKTGEEIIYI